MTNEFRITHVIESVNCALPADDDNAAFEAFLENAITGIASIRLGEQVVPISKCGLLRLSRSLIRLFTFPALYGEEASETVLDSDIDFRSARLNCAVLLYVFRLGHEQQFEIPLADALSAVGEFNRSLVVTLLRKCPTIRQHGTILVKIPDAFALADAVARCE